MIMASNVRLAVGEIKIPDIMYNQHGEPVEPQPCLIIREATKEEYENQVLRLNPNAQFVNDPLCCYYYEVHTD